MEPIRQPQLLFDANGAILKPVLTFLASGGRAMSTSPRAISSLRLGLLSFLLSAFTGLPAIIQGIRGLRDIRRNAGRLTGTALAVAGIGTGVLGTSLGASLLWCAVQKVRQSTLDVKTV